MTFLLKILLVSCAVNQILCRGPFRAQFPVEMPKMVQNGVDPGSPLFLTPYIRSGQIQKAQQLSQVGQYKGFPDSHSGFITVDPVYNGNLFFWFFPAQNNPSTAPVVIWLQGGPGGSSLFGLFVENGPIGVDINMNVYPRNVTWNSKYSMLYIDNPVGTGFSFSGSDAGYSQNETVVGENLYQFIIQFYQLFPELKKNDLYISGESYAGKYIPAMAYRIHKEDHPKTVPLKGVAIGDGFTDPPLMVLAYADYLFEIGMLDEIQRDYFQKQMEKTSALIKQGKFVDAFQMNNEAFDWLTKATACYYPYNYLICEGPADFQYYNNLLALPEVRKALHVGSLPYNSGDKVEKNLESDILDTVKPWLAEVMNYYRVLIYSGQLDIIVAHPLTDLMLQNINWVYEEEFKKSDRKVWKIKDTDTDVAGYVRNVHDFYQVLVRGGGHILPYDQPERSFDMIDRFISGTPF